MDNIKEDCAYSLGKIYKFLIDKGVDPTMAKKAYYLGLEKKYFNNPGLSDVNKNKLFLKNDFLDIENNLSKLKTEDLWQ